MPALSAHEPEAPEQPRPGLEALPALWPLELEQIEGKSSGFGGEML